MNLDLTPDELLFRARARDWLQDNVPTERRPREGVEMRDYDVAWQRRQYDGRWAGVSWPIEHGGVGLSVVEEVIWQEEAARAGAPDAGVCFVGLHQAGPALIAHGTPELQAAHLTPILRGDAVWCQAFAEAEAGSDLAALACQGELDGDAVIVTGEKIWTSVAHLSDFQELLVRTDPRSERYSGLTYLVCDMRSPGITVEPIRFVTGVHHFNRVIYERVRVPLSHVVGAVNKGWTVVMSKLAFERGTTFAYDQVALGRSVDRLINQARARFPNGASFTSSEIGHRLARLRAETAALRALTYMVVARNARRANPSSDGSMLKLLQSRLRQQIAQVAMEIVGVDGLKRTEEGEEYLLSFQASVGGGADEIHRNIVAQRILGLPRQT